MAGEEVGQGLEAEIIKGLRTAFEEMDGLLVFIEVMVSRVHTYLKTYETGHVKYVQFII